MHCSQRFTDQTIQPEQQRLQNPRDGLVPVLNSRTISSQMFSARLVVLLHIGSFVCVAAHRLSADRVVFQTALGELHFATYPDVGPALSLSPLHPPFPSRTFPARTDLN